MGSFTKLLLIGALLSAGVPLQGSAEPPKSETAPAQKCEHGVKKAICTRCNPKLEPVFKNKGDWCTEHKRPESQCAICHPKLVKEGVKP